MASIENRVKLQRRICIGESIGRGLAAISALVSLIIIVTTTQTVTVYGVEFSVKFQYSTSLKYLVAVDAIVFFFSVLSALLPHFLKTQGTKVQRCFVSFLHDLVMAVLMISGCAAATAIGYVSQFGQDKMGWIRVCNRVEDYCSKMTVALAFSYVAFFFYMALTILSAKKLLISSSSSSAK